MRNILIILVSSLCVAGFSTERYHFNVSPEFQAHEEIEDKLDIMIESLKQKDEVNQIFLEKLDKLEKIIQQHLEEQKKPEWKFPQEANS